jgi:putative endonuclease
MSSPLLYCHPREGGDPGKVLISKAMSKQYYVYVLASKRNGTLYVGVTDDLVKRVDQHKDGLVDGFTKKYKIHMLVHYESGSDVNAAILREKQLKKWDRAWKMRIIEEVNPEWRDLYYDLL